jgi:putative MATE family efflux protein
MHVQPEALADATVYLRVVFIGMPFTCLYNIYAAALRSVGDSRTPVRYLILSCVINTLLDLLLVAVFHLGVLGAALATAAAQGVSALLCIIHVSRNVRELHFSWRKLGINRALARKTMTYGGLSALQQCAQPIGNLIIQGSINTLGITAAAAFSAARKIEDIGLLPGRSISVSMTSLIAQNMGAGEKKRIEQGFQKGMLLETCSGLLVCAVILLLRGRLMSLFSADPEIIRAGRDYFQIIGFCYFLPCLSNGIQGYFRGIGAMKTSLFASLTQISFRVLATLLLAPRIGISGVALACIIGWSAMLLWTIPWRRYLKKNLAESPH